MKKLIQAAQTTAIKNNIEMDDLEFITARPENDIKGNFLGVSYLFNLPGGTTVMWMDKEAKGR